MFIALTIVFIISIDIKCCYDAFLMKWSTIMLLEKHSSANLEYNFVFVCSIFTSAHIIIMCMQ